MEVDCRKTISVLEVILFQVFVALLDFGGGFGLEFFEEREKPPGVEGLEDMVGMFASRMAWSADDDDRKFRLKLFERVYEVATGHVFHARIGDDAIESGELAEGFDGFFAAVGGDDVELGGFDDELAGGDAGGGFAIDDEVTRADHDSSIRSRREINCSKRTLRGIFRGTMYLTPFAQ